MAEEINFDPLNRFVWTGVILTLMFVGIFFTKQGRSERAENHQKGSLFIAIGGLYGFLGISRLLFFISDYLRNGEYIGHTFVVREGGNSYWYNQMGKAATIFFLIGMVWFFFQIWRITNWEYLLGVCVNVGFILWIFLTRGEMERLATYFAVGVNVVAILGVLAWFSRFSSKNIQLVSHFLLLGTTFYVIGSVFDSGLVKPLGVIHPLAPAGFMLVGSLLAIVTFFFLPKTYTRMRVLLIGISSVLTVVIISTVFWSIQILILAPDNAILFGTFLFVLITAITFLLYTIYRLKLSMEILEGKQNRTDLLGEMDFLTLFFYQTPNGNLHCTRDLDQPINPIVDKLHWEEGEREEFIQYLLSLTPLEREHILDQIKRRESSKL